MMRYCDITTPAAELALQRSRYKELSDEEWRWLLQQVDGRQRTRDKLPSFYRIEDWQYPVRLSCEQCSSELTARYKASLAGGKKMVDLTGGYGVDTYYLSEHFAETDYVERDEQLCRIATHNFQISQHAIHTHHMEAEHYLEQMREDEVVDLIYLDPYRRNEHGGKVFRLCDCTPDVTTLWPTLHAHARRVMIKLSPMLDLSQALRDLPGLWDCHIVAVKNEVKELLLLSDGTGQIHAVDLAMHAPFVFKIEEEHGAASEMATEIAEYVYEPSAAIIKAGAYRLIGERYGVSKLDSNTHLYTSEREITDWPGRRWRVLQTIHDKRDLPAEVKQANVVTRNYPMTPEQIRKKLHLQDGGQLYVLAARLAGKPMMLLGQVGWSRLSKSGGSD